MFDAFLNVKTLILLFYVLFFENVLNVIILVHKTGVVEAHERNNRDEYLNGILHRF